MKKLQVTKKSELITPLAKIAPPPPSIHLNKSSQLKYLSLLKQFTVIVFSTILIIACNAIENNEAKTNSQTEITVTEIPKRANTDVRDSYVLFSIEANKNLSNYHLAVKEKGKTAPATAEMTDGALKRNLSTNPINVLIAQRLNAPIISYAQNTNSGKTLGTGMSSTSGLVFDSISDGSGSWTPASGTHAWIAESVLKESTQYILYGMDNGGTEVSELLTFTTDATPLSSANEPADQLDVIDTTLVGGNLEIAVHTNEWYIFPIQTQIQQQAQVYSVQLNSSDIASVLLSNRTSVGPQIDPDEYLFLFKTVGNPPDWEEMWEKGAYVLMNTDHRSKSDVFHYSLNMNTGTIYPAPAFQNLKIQQ